MEPAVALRKQFIEQFTHALILGSRNREQKTKNLLLRASFGDDNTLVAALDKKREKQMQEAQPLRENVLSHEKKEVANLPAQQTFHLPPRLLPAHTQQRQSLRLPFPNPRAHMPRLLSPQPPRPVLVPPPRSQPLRIDTLSKIDALLTDPGILTIECPGPGLPLMIDRQGIVQSTPFHFSSEELVEIMHEVSQKTRIPLGVGIFKAAIGDSILTAVLSEYAGTRFILQKKAK